MERWNALDMARQMLELVTAVWKRVLFQKHLSHGMSKEKGLSSVYSKIGGVYVGCVCVCLLHRQRV